MDLSSAVTAANIDDATTDGQEAFATDVHNVTQENPFRPSGFHPLDISAFITLWPTSLTAITAISLPGAAAANLWVLTTWIRTPSVWKSSFHILLMNHALANFLLACVPYPIMVYRMTTLTLEGSATQTILCRVFSISMMWLIFFVLSCNGFTAVNRALACYPNFKLGWKLRGRKATICVTVSTWVVVSIFLASITSDIYAWDRVFVCLPIVQLVRDYADPSRAHIGDTLRTLVNASYVTVALLTLVVCCFSYGLIGRHLCVKKHHFNSASSAAAARRLHDMARALTIIVATFTTFAACWLPTVLGIAYDSQLILHRPILMALPAFETLIVPVLYIMTLPAFRVPACVRRHKVASNAGNVPIGPTRQSLTVPATIQIQASSSTVARSS